MYNLKKYFYTNLSDRILNFSFQMASAMNWMMQAMDRVRMSAERPAPLLNLRKSKNYFILFNYNRKKRRENQMHLISCCFIRTCIRWQIFVSRWSWNYNSLRCCCSTIKYLTLSSIVKLLKFSSKFWRPFHIDQPIIYLLISWQSEKTNKPYYHCISSKFKTYVGNCMTFCHAGISIHIPHI